ncbi:sugar phosphate isomerase/epimerase [Mesorhizobium sp. M9A.F.Ca.ET.002.03.1.2]|uniref:sugar phosphate isomerase/epimerase family protein n=1 Tax=Mesorhizobium sp. M9A.F.Ca.ET.002.03.1.2 TaxID=2493668 RepID=UPI000F75C0EF|nr:TIM barrel protein [Mesorhizobium sp. M9A.F.Ca.ET.002.03.1.2]AZN96109.1 sugar phosphate isomerase/epimerase [Mesorhizobium sp. M9A.F.Ca.ET.002.03.1.2]
MSSAFAMPHLGLAHFSAIGVPPVELVGLAAGAGFSAVGLRLYPAFPGAPFYELPAGSAASRDLRNQLDDTGISVYDIEFVTISPEFTSSAIAPILEAARVLGAQRVSVCGDDPQRSRLVSNFAALCDLASEFEMSVDLENMGWRSIATFSDSISVVEEAGKANGGVLVDALHFSRNGGAPGDLRAVPTALIRSVQLCDAAARPPRSHEEMTREARTGRLAPGFGSLPLVELLRELPAGAALSVEVPIGASDSPPDHIRRLFNATREILKVAARTRREG